MPPRRSVRSHCLPARRLQTLAVILLVLGLLPVPSRAAPSPPQSPGPAVYTGPAFISVLGRLKTGLESARNSTAALRAYRQSLPPVWAIDAGGRRFYVPTDLLTSRLNQAEKQPEIRVQKVDQARAYLDALAGETASLSAQPASNSDSARAKLNTILARSEYARTRQQSWWEKIRERINEILVNALLRVFRSVGGQTSLGYILLWIGVCGAAVLIAYWIFRQWAGAARDEEMGLEAAAVPSQSWQEWIFAARQAAARADYRVAVHCSYWAGIARLQELGALAPDRAKTPREYLRALTKSKALLPEAAESRHRALSLLTSRLERIWYGYQTATEVDFRDTLVQLETLGCPLN